MQHKFDDISRHVSMKGLMKLDQIAAQAAQVARERESAAWVVASSASDSAWIIAQVAYGREQTVENAMRDAGILVCVPMRMGPERKRHRKRIPSEPMTVFDGVVFIFCRPSGEALRGVKSFEHVKGVLMNGETAVRISDETVSNFKDMAARGEYDWERPASTFLKDQKVRITSGPFVGFEVTIEGFASKGHGDAVVTINIFGRPTVFNMPLAMLERV